MPEASLSPSPGAAADAPHTQPFGSRDIAAPAANAVYNAQVIQDAINNVGSNGGSIYVPPGIYMASRSICVTSNIALILDPGAIIRRDFSSGASEGALTQSDLSEPRS